MNKLKEMDIVKRSELIIDPAELGYDVSGVIGITSKKGSLYNNVSKEK